MGNETQEGHQEPMSQKVIVQDKCSLNTEIMYAQLNGNILPHVQIVIHQTDYDNFSYQ